MPPSPPRDPLAHPAHNLSQAKTTELLPPPSPRTHRLRKLQSAHNLGSKAALQLQPLHQPSLISQQRLTQITQRNISPTRRDPSSSSNVARHTRGRSNSDAPAPVIHHINALATGKRSMMGISPKYATMSLQQLIKEGPPEGETIEALGMARRKILSEGIKSDSDGMVNITPHAHQAYTPMLTYCHAVNLTYIRLAHPAGYPCSPDRRLLGPDSPRSLPSLLQDSQRYLSNPYD